MKITSRRYHSANDANKEQWAAQVLNRAVDHALLRDEEKGLLAQVEAHPVREIAEESIIDLWRSIPRRYQANAAFYMNWTTYNTLISKFRDSPYGIMGGDHPHGFRLMNKPVILSNDMPCGNYSNEVLILYGAFSQVEVLQQGTEPMQEHKDIAFPGTVECTQDGYAQVRLLDKQAVKGLRLIK